MTTFDRYLLTRFWQVLAIGFTATYGLYVVFDAFSNADEFQSDAPSSVAMMLRMAEYYAFQAMPFFDLAGPVLVVLSAMAVFALLQKQSEIYPILSAGIPTWRLSVPIVVGALSIIVLLTVNQEIIIPRIAARLQSGRGSTATSAQLVQTQRDHENNIEISGQKLFLSQRKIEQAGFWLPVPDVVTHPVTVVAQEAIQYPRGKERPAGWLLRNVSTKFDALPLTDFGRTLVYPGPDGEELFIVTDITADQLQNRSTSFKYLSTAALLTRIRNPATGMVSIRSQTLHLHERLTRPVQLLFLVLISIPLTIRRESRGLLANVATTMAVLVLLFLMAQASLYLGRVSLVDMDMAAWLPLIVCGTLSKWLASLAQT